MTKAEALKKIAEGIDALIEMEEAGAPAPSTEKKAAKGKKESAPKVEPEEVVEVEQKDVKLEDMEFNELKAMAKDLGCKAVGTKAQLIKAIQKALAEQEESDEQDADDEGAEVEDADESDEELDEDDVKAKIDEAFADYTDAELRDFLKQLGVSAKGSRDVLMSKIYDHADEIDFGESDDEGAEEVEDDEDVNTVEEDDSAENEIGEGDDDEEADEEEDSDDDEQEDEEKAEGEMTEARAKAIEEFESEQRDAFENGELDVQEMKDFLAENYGIKLDKKIKPQEVLEKYIEKAVNFIDDEGNTVEQGVYVVNGENFCCGNPLKITKNKKGELSATCAICGEKYEFDEDDE